jgi:hypothetical protein
MIDHFVENLPPVNQIPPLIRTLRLLVQWIRILVKGLARKSKLSFLKWPSNKRPSSLKFSRKTTPLKMLAWKWKCRAQL